LAGACGGSGQLYPATTVVGFLRYNRTVTALATDSGNAVAELIEEEDSLSYLASCLCGQVRLAIDGPITAIIHCHCSKCRKSTGSAYATNGFVATADLQLLAGAELLQCYSAAPGKKRYFCQHCGSPVYSANQAEPHRLRIRLGLLDCDIREQPLSHNFVSSKANWDLFDCTLPQYDGYEPGR
jgi:hypothetical protein